MKRILSYLSIVLLSASVACSDSSEMDKAYNSVITPGFTFGEEEIIAGITPVTFTNTTTAEGTTVSEYFWHFGFAGEGNWSEEAAPDPIVYNRPGDYTVTLTAWGADGNRATTTRTITVLADNVLPTAGTVNADGTFSASALTNGQIDPFRRRNRVARMALPRRHDLDGHQRDLHVRTNGHVQRPADRDR